MTTWRGRLLLGLLLGAVVMAALALAGDLRQVARHLAAFHWGWAPWILSAALMSYGLRFAKWHYLVRQVQPAGLSPGTDARIFFSGFPLSVTPGKLGEAVKAVWLKSACGLPISRGLTVVVADRLSDAGAMLVLGTLGVFAFPGAWPAFALVAGGLAGIWVAIRWRSLGDRVLEMSERLPLGSRWAPAARRFLDSAHDVFRPRQTLVAVGLASLAWLGEGLATFGVLLGLGVSPSLSTAAVAVFAFAFATIVGALSALPGGLGATEASLAGLLGWLVPLPASTAVAATLMLRLATLWFAVLIGLATWAASPKLVLASADQPLTVAGPTHAMPAPAAADRPGGDR